jgi:hypothetical protein
LHDIWVLLKALTILLNSLSFFVFRPGWTENAFFHSYMSELWRPCPKHLTDR